ncbi:MAG: pre-peptidase C-terminal domain-containing protein [Actinomycetota bacterium]
MTGNTRRSLGRLTAVLGALAVVGAACGGASTSGPEAEVLVRVVDGDTESAALATQATDEADTTTDGDPTTDADDTGDTTEGGGADEPPTVAEGSIELPSAADNLAIALPVLEELNSTNDEEPVTSPDVNPITFGEINSGDIESVFAADYWTFSGTEGQILTVEVLSIGTAAGDCRQDLDLYLADSRANRWDLGWIGNGGCEGHGPFLLPTTGDYELQFVGGDGGTIESTSGPYQFVPRILTERDESSLTFDTVQGGEISEVFGSDVWTFDATAGQVLAVEILTIGQADSCRQDLDLFIVDPLGQRFDVGWIGNGGCRAQGPFVLDETGTYALEFAGGDGGTIESTTGIYQFRASLT